MGTSDRGQGRKINKATVAICQLQRATLHSHSQRAGNIGSDKDNYQCIQKVFGPVIEETMGVLSNTNELDLKVDLTRNHESKSAAQF